MEYMEKKEEKLDTPCRTSDSQQLTIFPPTGFAAAFRATQIPFPFSTHTNASSQERIHHWIWKLLHGTPSLVDEAEETREIEEQGSKKQGAMAFLLPKLTTPSGPSCKLPPSPLLKPQLAQPGHSGGKIQGSVSGAGAAQVAAPGHLSLLLLLSAPQQAADPASKSTATKNRGKGGGDPQRSDFYLNLGTAVRTLRDDLPDVFDREPNYDIYREDITFVDPLNTFHGIDNYKTIFWALRFHGRLLFREIGLDVSRIWQLTETSIVVRWELWGTPRVPWESYGCFSGTSRYKVDRNGKIYEHKVDNLALDFPRSVAKVGSIADMVVATPSPNLTFWNVVGPGDGCSWTKLYEAVVEAVEREEHGSTGIGVGGLPVPCSFGCGCGCSF